MNYINVELFYGVGLSIQAVTDAFVVVFEEVPDDLGYIEVEKSFNGVLLDFLCFRILMGRVTD